MAGATLKKDLDEVEQLIEKYRLNSSNIIDWIFSLLKLEYTEKYIDIKQPCVYEAKNSKITWLPMIEYFEVIFYGGVEVGIPLKSILKDLFGCENISELRNNLKLLDSDFALIASCIYDEIKTGEHYMDPKLFDV